MSRRPTSDYSTDFAYVDTSECFSEDRVVPVRYYNYVQDTRCCRWKKGALAGWCYPRIRYQSLLGCKETGSHQVLPFRAYQLYGHETSILRPLAHKGVTASRGSRNSALLAVLSLRSFVYSIVEHKRRKKPPPVRSWRSLGQMGCN